MRRASATPVSMGLGDPMDGNSAGPETYVLGEKWSRPFKSVTESRGSLPIARVPHSWCVVPSPSLRVAKGATEARRLVCLHLLIDPIDHHFVRVPVGKYKSRVIRHSVHRIPQGHVARGRVDGNKGARNRIFVGRA